MSGTLLLLPAVDAGSRAYTVDPAPCKQYWFLTLFQDGEPVGGGRFKAVEDDQGCDEGYQDAIDQGEAWL